MKAHRRTIPLLLGLLTTTTCAVGQEYKSIDQFLTSLVAAPVLQVVEGDLNGDGLGDRAIVTHQPNSEISPKLYILLQTPRGNFTLAKETLARSSHAGSVELAIQRDSLYVHLETVKPGNGQVTHQFKLYRGAWRLIGSTRLYPSTESIDPAAGVNFATTDTNLLTGEVIETNTISSKVTRRREKPGAPCFLVDYDFDFGFCGAR